jgi:hypothetical protein
MSDTLDSSWSVPEDFFDEYGLPAAESGQVVWEDLLRLLLKKAETRGWDGPGILYEVRNPVLTEAALIASTGRGASGTFFPENEAGFALSIEAIGEFSGDYWQTLCGVRIEHAAAIILVVETWEHGSEEGARSGLRPSAHPDRVESRMLRMITRAGQGWSVFQKRGKEPEKVKRSDPDDSPLDVVLCRVLGIEPKAEPVSLGSYLAGRVLNATALAIKQLQENSPAASSFIDLMPHFRDETGQWLWDEVAVYLTLLNMRQLAWRCVDRGARPGSWDALNPDVSLTIESEWMLEFVQRCQQIADEGFCALNFESARDFLLPGWMDSDDVTWAGEVALGRIMDSKFGSNTPANLKVISTVVSSEQVNHMVELLTLGGWVPDLQVRPRWADGPNPGRAGDNPGDSGDGVQEVPT